MFCVTSQEALKYFSEEANDITSNGKPVQLESFCDCTPAWKLALSDVTKGTICDLSQVCVNTISLYLRPLHSSKMLKPRILQQAVNRWLICSVLKWL